MMAFACRLNPLNLHRSNWPFKLLLSTINQESQIDANIFTNIWRVISAWSCVHLIEVANTSTVEFILRDIPGTQGVDGRFPLDTTLRL